MQAPIVNDSGSTIRRRTSLDLCSAIAGCAVAGSTAVGRGPQARLHALKLKAQVALSGFGPLQRTAIVYGSCARGEALVQALAKTRTAGVRVAGVFDDRGDQRHATTEVANPRLGGLAALKAYVRAHKVDVVIMALPLAAAARIAALVKALSDLPVDVRLAAIEPSPAATEMARSFLGGIPMINLADRPIRGRAAAAKRALDVVVAGLAVVALAPVMASVAAAVAIESRGPVLFRQKRYGFNNELIEVFKFRSMYQDRADATASKLVTKNDPRVTRVGRIIRKASLDELPQLFNVLVGSLSLVGPRPHAVHAKAAGQLYPDAVDRYFARHNVKPGITGWAQVNGWRGETDTLEKIEKRVAFDLDYIQRWSILLDLTILARTPIALLQTDNAY